MKYLSIQTFQCGISVSGLATFTGGINTNYLQLDTSATPTLAVGMFRWNDSYGVPEVRLKGGNVTGQIFLEELIRIVNKTGADLNEADFRVVRIRSVAEGGAQGQRLAVVLAQADSDANSATTIGIVTETILNNQEGFINRGGEVNGIDTTGTKSWGGLETWVDGDILYLDADHPGYLTKVKPIAPKHTVILGWVVYSHSTSGKIFVKIDNGYELEELHDVLPTPYVNNGVLYRDTVTNLWKSTTIATLLGYTPANASGTTNYVSKFTGSTTLGNSLIYDDGTSVGIGTTSPGRKLEVYHTGMSDGQTNGIKITAQHSSATARAALEFYHTYGTRLSSISTDIGSGGNDPSMYIVHNSITALKIASNGNLLVNTTTDSGYKLDVTGIFRTLVNTETNPFRLEHTNGNYMTMVVGAGSLLAAGQFGMYFNGSPIWNWNGSIFKLPNNALAVGNNPSTLLLLGGYGGSTVGTSIKLASNTYNGGQWTATTGAQVTVEIGSHSNETWAPSSGNASYTLLSIAPRLNTSGTYAGIVRGLYYNPTLTAVVGVTHRAIETVTGDVLFGTTSGNVGIGTTTPSRNLDVVGSFRTTGQNDFSGLASSGHVMAKINDNGTLLRFNSFAIENATSNAGQQANLAVGSTFTNVARLYVKGSGSTSATTSLLVQNSSASAALTITDDKTSLFNGNVTIGSNSEIDANSRILVINGGYGNASSDKVLLVLAATNNVAYGVGSKQWIYFGNGGVSTSSKIGGINLGNNNYESGLVFNTTSGGNDTEVMRITNSKTIGIGTTSPSARLQIVGTGSTSATTSLLVQNSSGTTALQVRDDLLVSTGAGLSVTGSVSIGTNQSLGDGNFSINVNRLESYNTYTIKTLVQNRSVIIAPGNTEILYANYYAGGNLAGVVAQDTAGTSLSTSAVLQANSTTRGFLQPRMTNTQVNAISTPATGLQAYDTTNNKNMLYNGSSWQSIATESYVTTQITNLINGAPAALDTLNELAAALGNDASFSTTVTNSIASKVPQTRTLTINGTAYDLSSDRTWTIANDLQTAANGSRVTNAVNVGATVVASFSVSSYDGATFNYVLKDGTNFRAGTVIAVWNGTIVQFTETTTNDIGNTTPVTLSVVINAGNAELTATSSTPGWTMKVVPIGI